MMIIIIILLLIKKLKYKVIYIIIHIYISNFWMFKSLLIHNLNDIQIEQLFNIVSIPNHGMQNMSKGQPWTRKKLNDNINFSKNDNDNNFKNCYYAFIVLLNNNNVVGLSVIHPGIGSYYDKNTIGILIDEKQRHKGYGMILINETKKFLLEHPLFGNENKQLYALVKQNNRNSNLLFKNFKFTNTYYVFDKQKKKTTYNVYELF